MWLTATAVLCRLLLPLRARPILLPLLHINSPVGLDQEMLIICQPQWIAQACIHLWQLLGIDLQATKST
jgi:hypothetical protein